MDLRKTLPMVAPGMAHLVTMRCEPPLVRNLCLLPIHAFAASFFAGGRLGRFLPRGVRLRCSFFLR